MNITIIGGCGSLGSMLAEEFSRRSEVSEIHCVDNLCFSDNYHSRDSKVKIHEKDILSANDESVESVLSKSDKVIWSADIDIYEFFVSDYAKLYYEKRANMINSLSERFRQNFILFNGITSPANAEMRNKIISDNVALASRYGAIIVKTPILYGAGPVSRFDTPINDMFLQAMMNGSILVSDAFFRFPSCNLFLYASKVTDILLGKSNKAIDSLSMYVNSKIEYAHMIKSVDQNINVDVTDYNMFESESSHLLGVELLEDRAYSINSTFKNMRQQLLDGQIEDITKDCVLNNKVVIDAFGSAKFKDFLKTME